MIRRREKPSITDRKYNGSYFVQSQSTENSQFKDYTMEGFDAMSQYLEFNQLTSWNAETYR